MNTRSARREPRRGIQPDTDIEAARQASFESQVRSVRDLAEQKRLLDAERTLLDGLMQAATAALGGGGQPDSIL